MLLARGRVHGWSRRWGGERDVWSIVSTALNQCCFPGPWSVLEKGDGTVFGGVSSTRLQQMLG